MKWTFLTIKMSEFLVEVNLESRKLSIVLKYKSFRIISHSLAALAHPKFVIISNSINFA